MLLHLPEPGLDDVVVLDVVDFLIRPATMIIRKHTIHHEQRLSRIARNHAQLWKKVPVQTLAFLPSQILKTHARTHTQTHTTR
jgi:hypothetical protein